MLNPGQSQVLCLIRFHRNSDNYFVIWRKKKNNKLNTKTGMLFYWNMKVIDIALNCLLSCFYLIRMVVSCLMYCYVEQLTFCGGGPLMGTHSLRKINHNGFYSTSLISDNVESRLKPKNHNPH